MTALPSQRRGAARRTDPELRGRRSEPRACLVLTASTEALSGRATVKLLDVSRSGARVQTAQLPGVGRDVILRCGSVDAFGTVAWAASDRCGIHFYEPISGRDLVALRSMSEALEGSEMTPEEYEAAADWANGFAR